MVLLIGLAGSYVTIFGFWLPRLNIQPLPTSDIEDVLSSNFSLTNQGSMSVYDVRMVFATPRSPMYLVEDGSPIYALAPQNNYYDRIAPMQSATFHFPFSNPEEPKKHLDFDILVYYRPAWYPFTREERFRFVTKRSGKGFTWLPLPEE